MIKKFIVCFGVFFCTTQLIAQNPAAIVAPKYVYNEFQFNLPTPSTPDAYDGRAAKGAQNILTDQAGKIIFFIVDERVYDRKGKSLGIMENSLEIDPSDDYHQFPNGYVSETSIVPIPNKCNEYYIFTTRANNPPHGGGKVYYSKLKVSYDINDNAIPGSGLEVVNDESSFTLESIVGSTYNTVFPGNDDAPTFAISKLKNGFHYLFVENHARVLRFKINENNISYENVVFDFSTYDATLTNVGAYFNRKETELIEFPNGDYRLAFASEYYNTGTAEAYSMVAVIDMNTAGSYVNGSLKRALYMTNGVGITFTIKGIEFSPNGQRLYVTHDRAGSIQSAFDYFDLNQAILNRNIITKSGVNMDDFQLSQIESLPDGSIILAANNRLVKISHADNPNFATDFNNNYQALINYVTHAPHTIEDYHCLVHLLQDNIDGMDYSTISPKDYTYDIYNASSTTDLVWEPNANGVQNNPFFPANNNSSVVKIKTLLGIQALKNITIKNMTFEFSPGAKVIVYNGNFLTNGGKLTLDGTTFTVDDDCGTDMWQGVEVWGLNYLPQNTTTSTPQGVLILKNASKIEHAYIGALASKRNVNISVDPTSYTYTQQLFGSYLMNQSNGGIIQTSTNSVFNQNQIGIFIAPYNSSISNISSFTNTKFTWDGLLKNPIVEYLFHGVLNGTKGVQFFGNDFENNSTGVTLALKGKGIWAINSSFRVVPYTVGGVDRNIFKNLEEGLYVNNANHNSFELDQTNFINCIHSATIHYAQNERITRNVFQTHEMSLQQSWGLFLNASTGYLVTENQLTNHTGNVPQTGTLTYGIIVRNSGDAQNQIYKNTFWNLKIGGQSEGVNGTTITSSESVARGLVWKCNTFNQRILDYDLALNNAKINYNQGFSPGTVVTASTSLNAAANNKFSLSSLIESTDHDIHLDATSQKIQYYHIGEAIFSNPYFPNARTFNPSVNTSENLDQFGGHVAMTSAGCKSIIKITTPIDQKEIVAILDGTTKTLKDKIDGGNTDDLIHFIETNTNLITIYDKLMSYSPYLTDQVLKTYIDKNPTVSQLKQVLIANSRLSTTILNLVMNSSLPLGTKTQIQLAQLGKSSEREKLLQEIYSNEALRAIEYNQLLHTLEMDPLGLDGLIAELELSSNLEQKRNLLDLYIQKGLTAKEQTLRNELALSALNTDFLNAMTIQKEIKLAESEIHAVELNPSLLNQIVSLANQNNDLLIKQLSQNNLNIISGILPLDSVWRFTNDKSYNNYVEPEAAEFEIKTLFVSIYPNPSNGLVNLDFLTIPDGKMEVKIYDLAGKLVYENTFENSNGEQINLSDMHKGLYLVKVLIDSEIVEVQKLELK